jgi:LPXTG-motif cell wall-anchored protein
MLRRVFVAAGVALVALATPAAAQQYPPPVNSFTVSDTTPTPGQTITATAQTFAAGASVTMTLTSDPVVLATATADGSGVVSTSATIPADTTLGSHTLTAAGDAPDGSTLSLTVSLNVVPADGAGGGGTGNLPRTGDDSSIPLARIGLALAALGGVILAVSAKRRRSAAAAA